MKHCFISTKYKHFLVTFGSMQFNMKIEPFVFKDLTEISELQPEGWSDLSGPFSFYLSASYCYPIKVMDDNKIIGLGASIVFKETACPPHFALPVSIKKMARPEKRLSHQPEFLL